MRALTVVWPGWGGGDFKLVVINQATGLVSSLRRQICLSPVILVGCEGSRSEPERSERERSEADDPSSPSQTGFRWRRADEAARPNRWLN